MTLSGKLGDVILHFNEAHFDQGLEIVKTGDKFVRLALISRNTQRRWIALSRLNPASPELGWSVMVLSRRLQPPFRQAAPLGSKTP